MPASALSVAAKWPTSHVDHQARAAEGQNGCALYIKHKEKHSKAEVLSWKTRSRRDATAGLPCAKGRLEEGTPVCTDHTQWLSCHGRDRALCAVHHRTHCRRRDCFYFRRCSQHRHIYSYIFATRPCPVRSTGP